LLLFPETPTLNITTPAGGIAMDKTSFTLTCHTTNPLAHAYYKVFYLNGGLVVAHAADTYVPPVADINDKKNFTCKASADGGVKYSRLSDVFIPTG
jgi:hypothetical protein